MIQAILFRELTCVNTPDKMVDNYVMNYYYNKAKLEKFMKKDWKEQLKSIPLKLRFQEKEDSITGLGQIFAKTGIKARNTFLSKGEKYYSYSNWKQRKKIWYKLKDNNAYNTTMVAKVLKMKAGWLFGG